MKTDFLLWQNDGLRLNTTGPWAESKYRTLWTNISMFSTGMKRVFEKRLYIDLYAGPGAVYVNSSNRIFKGSPLLALSVRDSFDEYILCEENTDSIVALKERISKNFADKKVHYVEGDCNDKVDEIVLKIKELSKKRKTLIFCFVDPFSLGLRFNTLSAIAQAGRVDFLVLLALMMDGNRNVSYYIREESEKIEKFLSDAFWRDKWEEFQKRDKSFPRFLSKHFEQQMLDIGYLKSDKANTKEFRSLEKNLPLYHLAFFSKSPKGYDFWNKGVKYSTDQESLF